MCKVLPAFFFYLSLIHLAFGDNPIEIHNYNWNQQMWEKTNIVEFSYTNFDSVASRIVKNKQGIDFNNFSKSIYSYNGNHLKDTITLQLWDGFQSSWGNFSRQVFTYNGNNLVHHVWQDFEDNQWVNDIRYRYSYNAFDLADSLFIEYYDTSNQIWSFYRLQTFDYDTSNQLIQVNSFDWNTQTQEWDQFERLIKNYQNNVLILQEKLSYINNQWQSSQKTYYTYDIDGQLLVEHDSLWNTSSLSFQASNRKDYTYYLNGDIDFIQTFQYDQIEQKWNKRFKNVFLYEGMTTIHQEDNSSIVFAYPNPINKQLNINTALFESEINALSLYNAKGQLVFYTNDVTGAIDCSSLTSGVYWLYCSSDDKYYSQKVIKQ